MGILPCPRGCGAFFDGGTIRTSRPKERHIELAKCRARSPGVAPLPRELDGPFMPTITTGFNAALMSEAQHAASDPSLAPVNYAAIALCLSNVDFTSLHMRTSCLQSSTALPSPILSLLTPVIKDLLERAHSTRGVLLRGAV